MKNHTSLSGSGWDELLGKNHIGALIVLCSGVALYAIDSYVTASLLPSAMDQLGSHAYYSWVATAFLIASIFSAAMVSRVLDYLGPKFSYLMAFLSFGIGMVLCALAQDTVLLLVGRFVQGLGGGFLSGLAYAVINAILPQHLWGKATAAISAMWGIGTFVGPALGGIFAQIGNWHGAFWFLAIATGLVVLLVPRAIPATRPKIQKKEPFPLVTLVFLLVSVLLISIVSVAHTLGSFGRDNIGKFIVLGIIGAIVFLFFALIVDRYSAGKIFPQSTYQPTALKWVYLTIAFTTISYNVERFVPLFGQKLGGLRPIVAGFLGTTLAIGWTVSTVISSHWSSTSVKRRAILFGSILVVAGLIITGVLQISHPNMLMMIGWAISLGTSGVGIGLVWPHLATQAMSAVADPTEANKASAAVSTTQLIANAFGSALSGLVVNLGGSDILLSARMLFFSFAAIALLSVLSAARSQI